MQNINQFTTSNVFNSWEIRERNDKKYLVVNGVAIVEGVLNHRFVPMDEFGSFVYDWNGVPVVIRHPKQNLGSARVPNPDVKEIGRFYNARLDGDGRRLTGEFWLDKSLMENDSDGQKIMDAVMSNRLVELSTGYFSANDRTPGQYNGKHYRSVDRNIHPDHIAILPDDIGACSVADGCGLNRNQANPEMCQNCECSQKFQTNHFGPGKHKNGTGQEVHGEKHAPQGKDESNEEYYYRTRGRADEIDEDVHNYPSADKQADIEDATNDRDAKRLADSLKRQWDDATDDQREKYLSELDRTFAEVVKDEEGKKYKDFIGREQTWGRYESDYQRSYRHWSDNIEKAKMIGLKIPARVLKDYEKRKKMPGMKAYMNSVHTILEYPKSVVVALMTAWKKDHQPANYEEAFPALAWVAETLELENYNYPEEWREWLALVVPNGAPQYDDQPVQTMPIPVHNKTGNLPAEGKKLWEKVYESSKGNGDDEETAAKKAWSACKKVYMKKGDAWVKKNNEDSEITELFVAFSDFLLSENR